MEDEQHMRRALALARRGAGRVEPNPMVGCVIVREGKVLGEGFHTKFGEAHAEIEALNALKRAGADARGATAYVTLEPCGHWGKTPPCAEALVEAGISRVVIGTLDPVVGHNSIERLNAAGMRVDVGVCEAEAKELIAPFTKVATTGLPYVICKWATTIDGAIATADGDSKWISNDCSRRIVHQMRARVDAVLVGIGTVLADDPALTARDVPVRRVARRVVMDRGLRIPLNCRLVQTADRVPVTVVTCTCRPAEEDKRKVLEDRGVEVVQVDAGVPERGMAAALRHLVREHLATNVLVEGGGGVQGAMVREHDGLVLADELMVFVGPKVLGDEAAIRPVGGMHGHHVMASAQQWRLASVRRVGDDVWMRYIRPGRVGVE